MKGLDWQEGVIWWQLRASEEGAAGARTEEVGQHAAVCSDPLPNLFNIVCVEWIFGGGGVGWGGLVVVVVVWRSFSGL